jgi:VWFA-related protein
MKHGVLVPVLLCPLFLAGEQPGLQAPAQGRSDEAQGAIFRTETNLALVSFQVVAKNDDFVADLRADEIELREDGVPQKVALFEGGRLNPRVSSMEVHALFDCSSSMSSKGVSGPGVFHANLLDEFPNVSIGIWGFSGPTLSKFTAPTRDSAVLLKAIDEVRGMRRGSTPLYGSLVAAARALAASPGDSLRLMVPISDGHPFHEEATQEGAARAARSAGIPIYPVLVGIYPYADPIQARFVELANLTGGRAFEFPGVPPDNLMDVILKRLAEQIRYSYTAGYYPSSSGKSGPHNVQVVLNNSGRGTVVGGMRSVQH